MIAHIIIIVVQMALTQFPLWVEIVLICLAVVSSLISILIPILYYIRKKCTEHPASLIAIISLLQALSNYNVILIAINIYNFEQFVNIANIFNIFVFYQSNEPDETSFCDFNFVIYIALQMMSIAYNVCFSLDLLLTIKWPFFTGKKRMKYYHICSILFVAIITPLSLIQAKQICANQFHNNSIYKVPLTFLISLLVFYLISLFIIVYSFQTPQNSQIRKKYIQHHRMLLGTLVLVWLFPIISNFYIIISGIEENRQIFQILNICSFVSLVISGGLINIVRFYTDPYLWKQIKKMIGQARYLQQSEEPDPDQEQVSAILQVQKKRKTKVEEHDVWNLPLANAVSTYHYQAVVTNIIQIVNETCADNDQEIFNSNYLFKSSQIKGSQIKGSMIETENKQNLRNNFTDMKQQGAKLKSEIKFQNLNYEFNGPTLTPKQIKQNLKFGSIDQIKRISKIHKKLDMIAVQFTNESAEKDFTEKNVFRSVEVYESYSSRTQSLMGKGKRKKTNQKIDKNLQVQTITIKVKSYGHPIFTSLRKLDGLTSNKIKQTLDIGLNSENIKKARQSLGASGSFFFFSFDNKLVIKTITESQTNVFMKILPSYYQHMIKNPQSLISRTYGLFSVEISGISKIHFIMLENTFQKFQNNNIKYKKYDLKGSTIKREVKNANAQVFKDINFLNSDDAFLLLPELQKKALFQQIKADITLLSNHNIMDYSLLMGVGPAPKKSAPLNQYLLVPSNKQVVKLEQNLHNELQWRYFRDSPLLPANKIYSISLIDYLQQFNFNKFTQLKLKKLFKGGGDISSIDTVAYYSRFLGFISKILVTVHS